MKEEIKQLEEMLSKIEEADEVAGASGEVRVHLSSAHYYIKKEIAAVDRIKNEIDGKEGGGWIRLQ